MISGILAAHLEPARARTMGWPAQFTEEEQARLAEPAVADEIDRLSFLDGWRRIQRTTPMILKAIERFDQMGDREASTFWIEHLDEEIGHDRIMREDLVRLFGSEDALAPVLDANPITPPSVALVGFFEWQATHGRPDLLIVLRLYLEWFCARMEPGERDSVHAMIDGGSRTLDLHHEADQHHLAACWDYLDRRFQPEDEAALLWALDYIAMCLGEAQVWTAATVLGRGAG